MKRHSIRTAVSATALLLASLLLAGCTASGSEESYDSAAPAVGAPDVGVPGVAAEGGAGGGITRDEGNDSSRDVISTGTMTITADDPIQAASDAVEIVEDAGGRIDSRSEQPATTGEARADGEFDSQRDVAIYPGPMLPAPSAQLVVRIPSEKLTATLDEIKKLGKVESVSIDANDVTAQSQDLDSRITALQASVDRLVALLAGATTTKDLIDIETALSTRQAELESLESQQRSLADQVDLSTISIAFGSVESAPIEQPSDFFSGISAGWQTLIAFVGGVLVALGFMLPWLIVIAVVGAVIFMVLRRRRRRRVANLMPGAESPSGATSAPTSTPTSTPTSATPSTPSEPVSTTME